MKEKDAFVSFATFLRKYTPFLLTTPQQNGLTHFAADPTSLSQSKERIHCLFKMTVLLLRYHDPVLEEQLRVEKIEQLLTKMFLAFFTNIMPMHMFVQFIDYYLQIAEQSFFIFILLAIILGMRYVFVCLFICSFV